MINRVDLLVSPKDLSKLPRHVVTKLKAWVAQVEDEGLDEVRRTPGFHDEPLKGKRAGQRSIRLSRAYRAIYRIGEDGAAKLVEVLEVHKHRY